MECKFEFSKETIVPANFYITVIGWVVLKDTTESLKRKQPEAINCMIVLNALALSSGSVNACYELRHCHTSSELSYI